MKMTIPQLDITHLTENQVVVDREAGIYLGHVTTALMDDGQTIYAVYPKCHALGQIVLKRSDDGGKTWSERLPVPESWTWSMECPTLYKLNDAHGKQRLMVFSGGWPAHRSVSEDGGATWSEFEPFNYGGIVFLSTMVCVGPGHYLALFHDEGRFIRGGDRMLWEVWARGEGAKREARITWKTKGAEGEEYGEPHVWGGTMPGAPLPDESWTKVYESHTAERFDDKHFELYLIETTDGGLTWSEPRMIANHPEGHLCEPCFVPSPDGKELIVLLRENTRKLNSMYIRSADGGKSWSEAIELPDSLTGDRHATRYLPDGRLFITFRDMAKDSPTRGSWVGWFGTYEDIVQGREGQYRIFIKRNTYTYDCAYPGLELMPDGTLVTTTYGHWDEGEMPYIVSVHLDPAQLDRMVQTSVDKE